MQLENIPNRFFVCSDCYFVHTDPYSIDKCPYCKNDCWTEYEQVEYEE